ncbi:MAG TPA: hypothetical protein VKU00_07645 [Chthonomonadaceae bacterium]|nr:hypothetical protein [Chthonomonadaceae bacterium]
MALIAGLALMFSGMLCLLCGGVIAVVRKQVTGFMGKVPTELHGMVTENVPEVKRGLAALKLMPRIVQILFGIGAVLSVLGWAILPTWWLKLLVLLGGVGLAFGAKPLMKRLTPLIRRRLHQELDARL